MNMDKEGRTAEYNGVLGSYTEARAMATRESTRILGQRFMNAFDITD